MTSPAPEIEQLQRRMGALEAEHFVLLEQVRQLGDTTECTARSLDDLEDALIEVSANATESGDAMAAAMARRQTQLDSAETEPASPPADPGDAAVTAGEKNAAGAVAPDLATLHSWVGIHIAPMVRRTTMTGEGGGIRWCRTWWEHIDAVERFIALYLAFAHLSAEQSALWLSVYLRDHVDPHLATLTSPYGPFHACTPRRHSTAIEPLGHAELTVASNSGGTDDRTTSASPGWGSWR